MEAMQFGTRLLFNARHHPSYRRRLPLLSPVWVTTGRLSSSSSHEGKFLNEHANIALIGTTLAHTNTRSCRHCVFAGGEEARYCTVE